MLRPIDNFFLEKEEPIKSCLQFLRDHILKFDKNIIEAWKYGAPFYSYGKKRCCYLWIHKKYLQPYIGFVDGKSLSHPDLLQENRIRMRILLIDPHKNIPIKKIDRILKEMVDLILCPSLK